VEHEAVVDGAGSSTGLNQIHSSRGEDMKATSNRNLAKLLRVTELLACICLAFVMAAQSQTPSAETSKPASARSFDTPEQAASALIQAADKFDVLELIKIFGPGGDDIVLTGEYPQDRKRAADFAAKAREKHTVSLDPKSENRAFVLVGDENWPFPVPIVKRDNEWAFDVKAGRQEILYRRIGYNELDAIQICHTFVEAQEEYSFRPREGYAVSQYAQRVVSSPGKQDGLAWQNPDGSWSGPLGEEVAQAIAQGYKGGAEPYHGYFFKVLKGQGPAAPLGRLDYVVEGVMIGGFALAATPAEYGVTGVKTFIVSDDGVVYQKDFGPSSLEQFQAMELFNPDKSWTPVQDETQ